MEEGRAVTVGMRAALVVACMALVASPRAAGAQPHAADDARAALQRGVEAFHAGRHEEAARALEASLRLAPTSEAWFQLGMVRAGMSRHCDAIAAFEASLARTGDPGDARREQRAHLGLEMLRQDLPRRGAECTRDDAVEAPAWTRWWLWTGVGVGALSLGAAAGLYVARNDAVAARDAATCDRCQAEAEGHDGRARTLNALTNVAWVTGAVVLAGTAAGLVYTLVRPTARRGPTAALRVLVAPFGDGASAGVAGTF